jgi:SAM-dependent methyltransferase
MDQTERHAKLATYNQLDVFEKIKRLIDFENCGKLRVLDVGCGQGVLDDHLRRLGHEVVGLDINDDLELAPPNYIQCDINQLWPVDERSFDLVICTDVPEHMYDPEHVLRESERVLKTDGRLIFGVPNHFDLRQRLRSLQGKGILHWDSVQYNLDAWNFPHIRFFTLDDLDRKFPQRGWRILRHQFNFMGCGLIPSFFEPLNAVLLRMFPTIFSGKFVVLACRAKERSEEPAEKDVYVPRTLPGM